MNDIAPRVRLVAARHFFGNDAAAIDPNASFTRDLKVSEFDVIDLAMVLEKEFRIVISCKDQDAIDSVSDAVTIVRRILTSP